MSYRLPVIKITAIRESSASADYRMIDTPYAASEVLRAYLEGADREQCVALLLDTRNKVIGIHTISIGSLNASVVHPRETFKAAIVLGAAAIIVCHNHPSGDPTPSQEDRALTTRLKQVGDLLGIPLLDHVILGEPTQFFSFKQQALF